MTGLFETQKRLVETNMLLTARLLFGDEAVYQYGEEHATTEEQTYYWKHHAPQMRGIMKSHAEHIRDDE